MRRYLIAGIDPGATAGIALIDLSGRKIATASTDGGMAEAVRIIERHGTPSLICCDVSPPPEMAQKLASYFSCRLFSPPREIREEEKRKIASGAGTANNHERDAYCAAVLGYRAHANRLRQIDSLEGFSQQEKEEVKHLLLKGYRMRDAFLSLQGQEEKKETAQEGKPSSRQKSLPPDELRSRIASLARENAHLRLLAQRLEAEKRELEKRVRLLENGVRQSLLRDSELRKLRFRLEQSLRTLRWHRPAQQQKKPPPQERARPEGQKDALNRLGEPKLSQGVAGNLRTDTLGRRECATPYDLERLVAEYRKGRK